MTPDDKDKLLRDKMDQAGLGELLPGFDRAAVWQQIAERVEKPREKTFAWRWVTSAAVAAGVLLAWVFLSRDAIVPGRGLQEHSNIQAVLKPAAIPAVQPAPAPGPAASAAYASAPVRKKHVQNATPALPAPQQPPAPQPKATTLPDETPATPAVAVTAPRPKVHAVHLLDLNNEDKDIALQPAAQPHSEPLIVEIFNARNGDPRPRYSNQDNNTLVLRGLVRGLNNAKNKD